MNHTIAKKIEHNAEKYDHWDYYPLEGYIYENLLDERLLSQLQKNVKSHIRQDTTTYGTHRTTFNFKNSKYAIVKHQQNARYQQFVYDLTFEKDWWEQTQETVGAWANDYLIKNINPIFYKFLKRMYELPPFNEDPENWIPYRWHMNVLEYDNFLSLHSDGDGKIYLDRQESNSVSLTFYLEEHQEGWGGELFTLDGFVYTPIKNSAIGFNGHVVAHGVRANTKPTKEPRLAFTTRWIHSKDVYFPKEHPKMQDFKLEWS